MGYNNGKSYNTSEYYKLRELGIKRIKYHGAEY